MVHQRRSKALKTIKQRVADDFYHYTEHARQEMEDEDLSDADVKIAIRWGHLAARQTKGRRGTRYLVRGRATDGREVEAVCRLVPGEVRIVTVYEVE